MSLQLLLPLRQPARQRPPGIPFHRRHHALPRRGLLRQRLPIPQSRSILHAAPIAPKHFPTPYPPLIFWKQLRHNTGRPCVGLNGTVVSAPHSEHVVRVSGRTRDPVARFALHTLQRFGSFVNCFSWKNSCSPAVNTNSFPQSTHFKLRSVNSISGFPEFTRRTPRLLQGADSLVWNKLAWSRRGPSQRNCIWRTVGHQTTWPTKATCPKWGRTVPPVTTFHYRQNSANIP